MATEEVPQRELRNNTAELLRRVERGERLRITVHGHPVADLVPADRPAAFVPFSEVCAGLRGLLAKHDRGLEAELREELLTGEPQDPFERYDEITDRRAG
jgi:prevent-host-death family protein